MAKVVVEIPEYSKDAKRRLVKVGARRVVLGRAFIERQLALPAAPVDPEPGVDYRLPQYEEAEIICDYVDGVDPYEAERAPLSEVQSATRRRQPKPQAAEAA